MTPRTCATAGCNRAPRPDSPLCGSCFDRTVWGVPRPVYRLRSKGRIEVRIEGGHWQRMGMVPKGGIRI